MTTKRQINKKFTYIVIHFYHFCILGYEKVKISFGKARLPKTKNRF